MLKTIEIINFKSIEKLKLDLGRVNVLIGENGSGKSSVLEALVFASAAEANKLDIPFLENRGLRVPEAKLMRSCFDKDTSEKPIEIQVYVEKDDEDSSRKYSIDNENETYSEWKISADSSIKVDEKRLKTSDYDKTFLAYQSVIKKINSKSIQKFIKEDSEDTSPLDEVNSESFKEFIDSTGESINQIKRDITRKLQSFRNFIIYSPQNKQLRSLKEEGAIRPVGIHGEGLFKLLREINLKQPEALVDIEKGLSLIGWYKSMDLETEPDLAEDELFIQDKYLPVQFTQRSANEGFLYVLFYMAIIVSRDTPKIFAIENIDAALNPKLCAKLTSYIVELSKKYDKQIFLTTQNPATLDGINIFDKEQKLFIVSRKKKGQTTAKLFTSEKMPKNENGEKIMLSEAMIKGFIGGIPRGF